MGKNLGQSAQPKLGCLIEKVMEVTWKSQDTNFTVSVTLENFMQCIQKSPCDSCIICIINWRCSLLINQIWNSIMHYIKYILIYFKCEFSLNHPLTLLVGCIWRNARQEISERQLPVLQTQFKNLQNKCRKGKMMF